MTDSVISQTLMQFFGDGTHTAANLLTHTLCLLAANPEVQVLLIESTNCVILAGKMSPFRKKPGLKQRRLQESTART